MVAFAQSIGRGLDNVIGIFSPQRQLSRQVAREMLTTSERQYAAAKTTRLTGNWRPVDEDVNTLIAGSSPIVRSRVRQLVRDFPYFTRAVNVLCNYTVGTGITLQARVKQNGKLVDPINSQIEDNFKRWEENADVGGKLHFGELQELGKRTMLEAGENVFIKRWSRQPNRFLPYCLQAIEPDRLTEYGVKPFNKSNLVHRGIEVNPSTGEVVGYHFDDEGYGKPKRERAQNVIHNFRVKRPGQLRGISDFAPVVLLAHDLGDFMEATMDRAKLAAKWLAFVTTSDIPGFQKMRAGGPKPADTQKIEDLENAIIEYLRPGETVNFAASNQPGDSFEPYVNLILYMIAVGCGVPYELLSGNYNGISYSTLRGKRNDLAKDMEPHQMFEIRHFCQPVYKDVLEHMVMGGKINLPGYFNNRWTYQRALWMPPGMESVDPLKESKAHTEQMKNRTRSPQEICRARGKSLEDVLDDFMVFKEMCESRGLTVEEGSTAIAQNPAKLEKE